MSKFKKTKPSKNPDLEFKKAAVQLTIEPGAKMPEIARNLGIQETVLRTWILELAPSGLIQYSSPEAEKRHLKKLIRQLTEERDILKKAKVFLSEPED